APEAAVGRVMAGGAAVGRTPASRTVAGRAAAGRAAAGRAGDDRMHPDPPTAGGTGEHLGRAAPMPGPSPSP
ncbi:hypothetical protein LAM23_22835, partial [Mycobacterium tuberculosis]|nr:hypothetical protein [Mycobacterium tuberculosis]